MAAVRSALLSLRVHRHPFTAGYVLVVPGGACAPGTNHDDNILDDNDETNDFRDFVSPLPSPSPYAPSGRHLVVSGEISPIGAPMKLTNARPQLMAGGSAKDDRGVAAVVVVSKGGLMPERQTVLVEVR
ncbi:hypothetical protein CYMTET_53772 [Cymbomonas tetramitiformis]|uniref:Uncharacterized protein n=1 Tax=Cymbomonas tetramitiformis TaxID=36881 RepID=A0AAE0BGD2_9CHLO|nr:hypothetical protein CYMTET_53772 [Cymbomonas tetramitiformis]